MLSDCSVNIRKWPRIQCHLNFLLYWQWLFIGKLNHCMYFSFIPPGAIVILKKQSDITAKCDA